MIQLDQFLTPESVQVDISGGSKTEIIHGLAHMLVRGHPGMGRLVDGDEVFRLLLERESLAATGIGNGVAVPHAVCDRVHGFFGGFARSVEPIDFGAIDGTPCRLFFVLLSTRAQPKTHIKALARISRLFGEPGTRDRLLAAPDAESVRAMLGDMVVQQGIGAR